MEVDTVLFLRVELFGWIGRQQFEETWMALLSVLNSTPSESTPPAELPFINLVKHTLFVMAGGLILTPLKHYLLDKVSRLTVSTL